MKNSNKFFILGFSVLFLLFWFSSSNSVTSFASDQLPLELQRDIQKIVNMAKAIIPPDIRPYLETEQEFRDAILLGVSTKIALDKLMAGENFDIEKALLPIIQKSQIPYIEKCYVYMILSGYFSFQLNNNKANFYLKKWEQFIKDAYFYYMKLFSIADKKAIETNNPDIKAPFIYSLSLLHTNALAFEKIAKRKLNFIRDNQFQNIIQTYQSYPYELAQKPDTDNIHCLTARAGVLNFGIIIPWGNYLDWVKTHIRSNLH